MLLNDFFEILSHDEKDSRVKLILKINKEHKIFKGHFPGQPIVPGVCMMQMVKESIEKIIQKKIRLQKAVQLKFLSMIDPDKVNEVEMEFTSKISEDGILNVNAELRKEGVSYFKMKAAFQFLYLPN